MLKPCRWQKLFLKSLSWKGDFFEPYPPARSRSRRVWFKSKKINMTITKSYLKDLVYQVNGATIEVHKVLRPGLLESVYHTCLKLELTQRGIQFASEMLVPVIYKGIEIDTALRCDFFIEKSLVVELKAVEKTLPIHDAQVLTYMKLLNAPEGLLLNFNVEHLFKQGQQTFVNELYRSLPD